MKKILILLVALLFMVGCQKTTTTTKAKPTVTVTTSFLYDMVLNIAKDDVTLDLIMPAGEDPHLYVAQPKDLQKIQKADLVLYHGLHFEGKMIEILEKRGVAVTKDFNKSSVQQTEENGVQETDPHFWFNIELYKQATKTASDQLIKLVPDKADQFKKNTQEYLQKLDQLIKESKEMLAQIPQDSRYLITPHDAFNYFSKFFNMTVMAPQGVSTNSEVSNQDIEKTAQFIVDHKIKAIFAESTTDPARMTKLQEITKAKGFDVKVVHGQNQELFSDSLAPKGQPGDNYIDMVKHNIKLMVDNLK